MQTKEFFLKWSSNHEVQVPSEFLNGSYGIGNFDGIHKGHTKILKSAEDIYKNNNDINNWGVIIFNPHPLEHFNSKKRNFIFSYHQKINKLKELKVPLILIIDFPSISNLDCHSFISQILVKSLQVKGISVGYNFFFGKDRKGDSLFLKQSAKDLEINCNIIEEQKNENAITYSSSNIREYIANGNVEKANNLLGYNLELEGKVIYGNQLGRTIGVPTANIILDNDQIKLKYGVYSAYTIIDGKKCYGIVNFGVRPTVHSSDDAKEILELHIFNYNSNLYESVLRVHIVRFVREEKKFTSFDELKNQIQNDIKYVKQIFEIKEEA